MQRRAAARFNFPRAYSQGGAAVGDPAMIEPVETVRDNDSWWLATLVRNIVWARLRVREGADALERGFGLTEVSPPQGDNDDSLRPQMFQSLGKRA